jgi:hypothetical protein
LSSICLLGRALFDILLILSSPGFLIPNSCFAIENLSLILLHALLPHSTEKEEMYGGFVQVLDHMEGRILRQREGEGLLEEALQDSSEE